MRRPRRRDNRVHQPLVVLEQHPRGAQRATCWVDQPGRGLHQQPSVCQGSVDRPWRSRAAPSSITPTNSEATTSCGPPTQKIVQYAGVAGTVPISLPQHSRWLLTTVGPLFVNPNGNPPDFGSGGSPAGDRAILAYGSRRRHGRLANDADRGAYARAPGRPDDDHDAASDRPSPPNCRVSTPVACPAGPRGRPAASTHRLHDGEYLRLPLSCSSIARCGAAALGFHIETVTIRGPQTQASR
jgi:hypothetical protein